MLVVSSSECLDLLSFAYLELHVRLQSIEESLLEISAHVKLALFQSGLLDVFTMPE